MLVDPHAAALLWEDDYELQDEDHQSDIYFPSACHQDPQPLPDSPADHIPQTPHSINPHMPADSSSQDNNTFVDPLDAAHLWSDLEDDKSDTDMHVDR